MDADAIPALFTSLQIPTNHTSVGLSNLLAANSAARALFHHKRLPNVGWTDLQIQRLLFTIAVLDTNGEETVKCQQRGGGSGFAYRWTGVGEREGRIYSPLISSMHYGLGHGIGRSGDVMEAQPKAAGSSVLLRLTLRLVLDAVRRGAGLSHGKNKGGGGSQQQGPASFGTLLPVCTGMSMALVLSGLRDRARKITAAAASSSTDFPHGITPTRDIVIWSRIDQKSCYKAILSAGLTCIVLPTRRAHPDTDEVSTDLQALKEALDRHGHTVLAVVTTTSCFCPRVPDEVDAVAKIIQAWNAANNHATTSDTNHGGGKEGAGVSHVINHAYGLQCRATNNLLNRACVVGRVDAIVCSTDKNFLVPVGGALVLSPAADVIESVQKCYPGRASASPMVDLFITLLSMGLNGYKEILEERVRLTKLFQARFKEVAEAFGEQMLNCPRNTISFGITLDNLVPSNRNMCGDTNKSLNSEQERNKLITKFGSMLFTRCISGTRVVPPGQTKNISGHTFLGFGSSNDEYPHAYMTAACAVGMGEEEMVEFFRRLEKSWRDYRSKREKERRKEKKVEEEDGGGCGVE